MKGQGHMDNDIFYIYRILNKHFGPKVAGEWLEFYNEEGGGEPDNAGDSSLDPFLDPSGESVDRRLILLSGADIDEASMGFIPSQACEAVAAELNNILIERANQ